MNGYFHTPIWVGSTKMTVILVFLRRLIAFFSLWITIANTPFTTGCALAEINPEAVPALIEALKDKDGEVRVAALYALSSIGPAARAAVPALIEALKDKDRKVHAAAFNALDSMGPAARGNR